MNTYINVPFEEKDAAKALGARWDQSQKSWYIPEGINPAPFGHWLPNYFYVVVGTKKCWRCDQPTRVVALGIPYVLGSEFDGDELDELNEAEMLDDELDDGGLCLPSSPADYDSLALIPRLGCAPKELRDFLEAEFRYRPMYSKTTGLTQLNNTCDHCGSLQGEFFDFDEPDGTFFMTCDEDIAGLTFLRVTFDGWIHGTVNTCSGADRALFKYASAHFMTLDIKLCEDIYLP